jgi:hypothetical protein
MRHSPRRTAQTFSSISQRPCGIFIGPAGAGARRCRLTPPQGFPLTVNGPITVASRKVLFVSARGSNDGLPGFPGWNATVDAATYAPVTVVDGVSCSHCFYLSYDFRLSPRG